jgi:signal transduction histidine kinase
MLEPPRWAFAWPVLLVLALLLVGLGYRVWRDRPSRDVNRWFAFQALVLAAWVAGVGAAHSGVLLNFWAPWTFGSAALLPLAFFGFTRTFPSRTPLGGRFFSTIVATISVGLCCASIATPWVVHTFTFTPEARFNRLTGPLYPLYAAFLPSATGALLTIQILRWRKAVGRARLQLQYYIVAVLIVAVGGFTTNLAIPTFTGRSTYSGLGPYFAAAFLALVGHSIIRHRLLDLRIVVSQSLTFTAAVIVSLVPGAAVFALFWPQLGGRLDRSDVVIGTVALSSVALLTPPLRDLAGSLLDRYVYRHRSNVRRVLRQASGELSASLDLSHVTSTLVGAAAEIIHAEGIALYLVTDSGIRLIGSNSSQSVGFGAPPILPAGVLRVAQQRPSALIAADEIERAAGDRSPETELDASLRRNDWALVAPIGAQGSLVGVLVIGRKLSGDQFSCDDLDAISTLANHAGSAVKNAQLYAESALAKDYIGSIVSTIQSGVIAVSPEGRIVLFNAAAEQMIGIPQPEIENRLIEALPQPLCDVLRAALVTPGRRTYPELLVSHDEPGRLAICTTAPLHDHAGKPAGAVAVFSDLTPLRELERQRSRAERLAEFQVLTQALAHEIANPLSPIKTMTRLLEHRGGDKTFVQEFRRIVTRELERIERLVDRLRTVGRPQRILLGRVNLCKAAVSATEVLTAIADERGISLNCDLPAGEVAVIGDTAEYEEVFVNLIKNAIEAIPAGSTQHQVVSIEIKASGGEALVRVEDTGPGFPSEVIDQIFVPFVSTKPRGSGLGLAICASVVQRAGGQIDVANAPQGGVVTLRLPLA